MDYLDQRTGIAICKNKNNKKKLIWTGSRIYFKKIILYW